MDLDPLSISAHDTAALVALCGGRPDRTIAEGGKILELVPDDSRDSRAYLHLSVGHFQKGMYQEALQEVEKGLVLSHRDPFFLAVAAVAHGRLGQMDQAAKLVEEMRADSKLTSVAPDFFAIAFVGMGQQKQAIDALEEAYKTQDAYMVALQSDPLLSPLHSNQRFQDLVRRMNFPTIHRARATVISAKDKSWLREENSEWRLEVTRFGHLSTVPKNGSAGTEVGSAEVVEVARKD